MSRRPSGVGIHDLQPDFTIRQAHAAIHALEKKRGELHKGKSLGYRTAWFATAEARDAWLRGPSSKKTAWNGRATREDRSLRHRQYTQAGWAPDAPVHNPNNVQVQVCPSAPPRFSEQVFSFVHHGLRAA